MDPRRDPSVLPHGPAPLSVSPPATVRRRLSMDEDLFYQRIMTTPQPRPLRPPPYETSSQARNATSLEPSIRSGSGSSSSTSRTKSGDTLSSSSHDVAIGGMEGQESLPHYWNAIELEGVFMKKHEIEDTTKRAEDRRWHTAYVTLSGTALNIHKVKKDRGWGKTRDGPSISPDNPPWVKKSKLEKSYSLLYADAGIAADYKKRRYVIRIRVETDQFLLSCIELSTFTRWLQGLFAAIDVALPIEDREFPRDMSIPRVQRVRWYRSFSPEYSLAISQSIESSQQIEELSAPTPRRRSSSPYPLPTLRQSINFGRRLDAGTGGNSGINDENNDDERDGDLNAELAHTPVFDDNDDDDENEDEDDQKAATNHDKQSNDRSAITRPPPHQPPRLEPPHRLSTTSYDNAGVDPHSGKWIPDHRWTSAHDLLYAKLCYSNLLFRSPRKSNFIISKGKKWFVDWGTGRMVRVLPPAYGEGDYFGPWQTVHTENMRI